MSFERLLRKGSSRAGCPRRTRRSKSRRLRSRNFSVSRIGYVTITIATSRAEIDRQSAPKNKSRASAFLTISSQQGEAFGHLRAKFVQRANAGEASRQVTR